MAKLVSANHGEIVESANKIVGTGPVLAMG